eukprot:jgi/Chrzof1/11259/Cz05g29220.t1
MAHSTLCHSTARCTTVKCLEQRPFCTARPRHVLKFSRQRTLPVTAALNPEVVGAVTQQATAFAVVLLAEGAYARSYLPESDKGRPQIPALAAGAGATLAAAALVSAGVDSSILGAVGLVAGLVAASAMLFYNVRRFLDLEYEDADWPGPKAWPGGMALISFFAVSIFFQALLADMATTV